MKEQLISNKNRTRIYISLVTVLLLILVVVSYFNKGSKKLEKKDEASSRKATISIEPLMFSQETEDKNKFILSADSAKFFQEEGKGILNNFSITYTYNEGKKLVITGTKAEVNINANKDFSDDISIANICSGGKVTAVSSEGYSFETRDLIWDGSKKVISTKEPIVFYGNNFKLTGKGLKADINNEEIEIISNVDVFARPEKKQDVTEKKSGTNEKI